MRYVKNKITDQKYLTARLPKIAPSDSDRYIIAREGDRLDLLAQEFYQDSNKWWILALTNNLGKGDLLVPAGKQIYIPGNINFISENLLEAEQDR